MTWRADHLRFKKWSNGGTDDYPFFQFNDWRTVSLEDTQEPTSFHTETHHHPSATIFSSKTFSIFFYVRAGTPLGVPNLKVQEVSWRLSVCRCWSEGGQYLICIPLRWTIELCMVIGYWLSTLVEIFIPYSHYLSRSLSYMQFKYLPLVYTMLPPVILQVTRILIL